MSDNNELKNKKLLILGGAPNEIPIIQRAQSFGVYVVVTDMYTDHNVSPGKDIADEYWDISWSDIDSLEKQCVENRIDGVLGGFSEIKIESQIKLCSRLNLPCYINKEQLEITRDKVLFKKECIKHGVPTIREYNSKESVDEYPVIVKPVDRAGSIGVGIAWNRAELEKAYDEAISKSLSERVIIEKYITDSTEIDAHYAITNGEISLLVLDDIIAAKGNQQDGKVVQSAWIYPSKYQVQFLSSVDCKLRQMIRGMGISDGTIFFSGFANNKGQFTFFECGYRLWGEQEFSYDYLQNGINYLDIYIFHALLGDTKNIPRNPSNNPQLKGVEINFYVKGGIIQSIEGFNEISNMEDCTLSIKSGYIGRKCSFDSAILTKAGLVGFTNINPQGLKEDMDQAYRLVHSIDQNGNDMVYDYVDSRVVADWWEKDENA